MDRTLGSYYILFIRQHGYVLHEDMRKINRKCLIEKQVPLTVKWARTELPKPLGMRPT